MSSSSRPSKHDVVTDFRRGQILDAARESFAKDGLAGTTVDGIARRAGVAKGTVYLYYKSKDDILRQVLHEDVEHFQEKTVPVISGSAPIDQRLTRFLSGLLSFFDEKHDFIEVVLFEMGPDVRKRARQKLEVVFNAQMSAWQAAITEAQRDGLVGPVEPAVAALTIVSLATGLAKCRMRGWADGDVERLAAESGATLWKGLVAR